MERIHYISSTSHMMEKVLLLSDKNKRTLGLIPRAAFIESAKYKCIIVLSKGQQVLGYCLFRKAKKSNTIKITQLCVDQEYRGLGYSEKLIDRLKQDFQEEYFAIGLNCRNDYIRANMLWERCGFMPVKEQRSRSKEGKFLTYWKYCFPKKDLFAGVIEETVNAVVDLNVVIKLRDWELKEEDEVGFLLSDLVSPEVSYFYSGESLREIMRDNNPDRRNETRRQIYNFFPLNIESEHVNEVFESLARYFDTSNVNDRSDCKQLAETIAAGIPYFITTDQGIISKRDDISDEYRIDILTPLEFFVSLDQILNEGKYSAQRLGGANFDFRTARYSELDLVIDEFLQKHEREKRATFKGVIKSLCLDEDSNLNVVFDKLRPLALLGIQHSLNKIIVKVLRSARGIYKDLLIRQLLNESVRLARYKNARAIEIHEKYLSDAVITTLKEFRFISIDGRWVKHLDYRVLSSDNLFDEYNVELSSLGLSRSTDIGTLYEIERYLYPLKLVDLNIPCYIVPIKAYWASQLFDFISAESTLFGASPHLVWERKNVYYRNVMPNIEVSPARILWYSSASSNFSRSRGIVAASYLDQVFIDKPKVLWRRLKKYGVYSWEDVYELSGKDVLTDIKALLFSDTEIFPEVLELETIRIELGKQYTFQGPVRIDSHQFMQLYKTAFA